MKKSSLSSGLLTFFLVIVTIAAAYGQAQDNPTGPAGMFNGNIDTGCSYDPYTGNAIRSVTDISVSGAVGTYALSFTRMANSRLPLSSLDFALSGNWNHNYAWIMNNSESHGAAPFHPLNYAVFFPDGRSETFHDTSNGTLILKGPGGTGERFIPVDTTTLLAYLLLADGGKIEFQATLVDDSDPEISSFYYTYKVQAIIDPYGLRTEITYPGNGVTTITEPGGRWLKIIRGPVVGGFDAITSVQAIDGRTVTYTYEQSAFSPGTRLWTYLSRVSYYSDPSIGGAVYTYKVTNVGNPDTSPPLLATCDDPMYAGRMKKIAYDYVPNATGVIRGQLLREKHLNGTYVSTVAVSGNVRTETRGDAPSRTFTYSGGMLTNWTNFAGNGMSQGRDPTTGYVTSFTDANGHTTDLEREPVTGHITKITHPPDANGMRYFVSYFYTDAANPYYLDHVIDERNGTDGLSHTTTYHRNSNHTISQIDYPDGGYETFHYLPPFNLVDSHRMTNGHTETFEYYGSSDPEYKRNLKKSWTDGEGHKTFYDYDSLGRLSTLTDPAALLWEMSSTRPILNTTHEASLPKRFIPRRTPLRKFAILYRMSITPTDHPRV